MNAILFKWAVIRVVIGRWHHRGLQALALGVVLTLATAVSAQSVLSNGTVSVGVQRFGELIYQGVGLTYVPTRNEALAPGCPCEGWGVADTLTGRFGKAGQSFGSQNVVLESFKSTPSTATSTVKVVANDVPFLRVTHAYRPAPETASLFEVTVSIENISAAPVDLKYRRAMDWDVPPTTFSEMVTVVTNGARDAVFSSDNGFADGNPLTPAGQILFVGEGENSGPADHGAVFDFNLGRLDAGASRTFLIYYGAAANVPAARSVLASVAAEVYSLGWPNTSTTPQGSPNTFIFAFKGVGGGPALTRDADLTIGGLRLIDNGTGRSPGLTARVGNAGGKSAIGFRVAFYDGDPAQSGAVLLGMRDIADLAKEDFVDVQLEKVTGSLSGRQLFAVVDPERRIVECTIANNVVSIAPQPAAPLGQVLIAPDQPSYGATSPVSFMVTATNPGSFAYAYRAQVSVIDAAGTVIHTFPARAIDSLTAGGSTVLTEAWQTANTLTGAYRARVVLSSLTDAVLAASEAGFNIGAGNVAVPVTTASIRTDHPSYAGTDRVVLTDRVRNTTANMLQDGLSAVTTVHAHDGSVIFTASEPLPQLQPGALRELTYPFALANAAAGTYRASLVVQNAAGASVATSSTTFVVKTTAQTGIGLAGTLLVQPKEVEEGGQADLFFTISNAGNSALEGQQLLIRILSQDRDIRYGEVSTTANVAQNGTTAGKVPWTVTAPADTEALGVLYSRVGGEERVLAQDPFRVAEGFKLTAQAERIRPARVLVLVSCPVNANGIGPDRPECVSQRDALIRAYLNRLGLAHLVTADVAVFTRELRSGGYNLYWVSGGAHKLDKVLAGEVREAVQRGDSLLLEGVHDERNGLLDLIVGVKPIGKHPQEGQSVAVVGANIPPALLPTLGKPLRLELQGAVVEAVYQNFSDRPAVVSNRFGTGRAVLMTWDWVGTLETQGDSWFETARSVFGWLAPALSDSSEEGSLAAVRFTLTNAGSRSVQVKAQLQLPDAFVLADAAPTAQFDASTRNVTWDVSIEPSMTSALTVWLRVPSAATTSMLTLTARPAAKPNATGTSVSVTIDVEDLPTLVHEAGAAIRALAPTRRNEVEARDRAATKLDTALQQSQASHPIPAIGSAVDAADELRRLNTVNAHDALLALSRVLKVLEARSGQ